MTPSVAVADRRTTPPARRRAFGTVAGLAPPGSRMVSRAESVRRTAEPPCMGLIVAFGVIPPPPLP